MDVTFNRGYKFRIFPTEAQAQFIVQTTGCCRFVHNYFLDYRKTAYETNGESVSYKQTSALLTKLKKTDDHAWLKLSDSMALQEALKDLDNAYAGFFKHGRGYPKFRRKFDHSQSYRTRNQKNSIRVEEDTIILPKLGAVNAVISRPVKGKINSATVSFTPTGKFYVSLNIEYTEKLKQCGTGVKGIDVGIKAFYTDSDGNEVTNPRYLEKWLPKLKCEQRKLSRMIGMNIDHYVFDKNGNRIPVYKKPLSECKNIQKQRIVVAKIHEKIANCRTDFLHKQALALVKENQLIGIEDLNVAGMKKNRKLARCISDVAWSEFFRILEYKAEEYGCIVQKVPMFFASSQTCFECGHKNKAVKDLKVRKWICPHCGVEHGRDINAAVNIRNKAVELFAG